MHKYDLIVAGGGLTGVAAAVSASRYGMSVLLAEKSGCLGGAISNNLVYPFMKYWTAIDGEKKYLCTGIFSEMRERMIKYDSDKNECLFKPEYFKLMLDELVAESSADVLFHATVCDVKTSGREVKTLNVATPSGLMELEADFFIDATGNGDIFAMAGCDFQLGRESDGLCQPMTTCFRMCGVDTEKFKQDREMLQEKYAEQKAQGKIKNPRENILSFLGIGEGVVHFNTTRIIKRDPTDVFDVSFAEVEARRQVYEIEKFLKANSPAFKNSTVISIANEIGIRESRKLKGEHILTEQELKDNVRFEDSIALGNYDIDIHNPAGSGTSHYYFKDGEYYTIPYRSLLPREYDNLIVAGRCISTTHEAQASIRIMPICACTGQAAGTAAATAYKTGTNAHTVDVELVRQNLKSDGAQL